MVVVVFLLLSLHQRNYFINIQFLAGGTGFTTLLVPFVIGTTFLAEGIGSGLKGGLPMTGGLPMVGFMPPAIFLLPGGGASLVVLVLKGTVGLP